MMPPIDAKGIYTNIMRATPARWNARPLARPPAACTPARRTPARMAAHSLCRSCCCCHRCVCCCCSFCCCCLTRFHCLLQSLPAQAQAIACRGVLAFSVKVSWCVPVMPCSRYKYLSWHKGINKYIVQWTYSGKQIYKAFDAEATSVSYLIKKTRSSEARLLRSSRPAVLKWSS